MIYATITERINDEFLLTGLAVLDDQRRARLYGSAKRYAYDVLTPGGDEVVPPEQGDAFIRQLSCEFAMASMIKVNIVTGGDPPYDKVANVDDDPDLAALQRGVKVPSR